MSDNIIKLVKTSSDSIVSLSEGSWSELDSDNLVLIANILNNLEKEFWLFLFFVGVIIGLLFAVIFYMVFFEQSNDNS